MSIIKHITLQKSVAHDFRYDPRIIFKVGLLLKYSGVYTSNITVNAVITR